MNAILRLPLTNSQEKAYSFLKDSIINLEVRPNQKLTAQEIANKLEISRTPVREAFSRLEQEGLLVRHGGWGYAVTPVTLKDAMNVFRMRETLEVEAVKEAAPRLDPAFLGCLEGYLVRADDKLRSGNIGDYRVHTRSFYRSIAQATDNDILEYMLSLISDRVRRLGAMITDRHFERPRESLAENRKILGALKAKDERAAVAAVRRHVSGARESFLRYVTENSDPFDHIQRRQKWSR